MTRDRCGYTHDISRFPDIGAVCCWRPVREDAQRCIWHADTASKPTEALASLAPTRGERLDGVIVRESTVAGFDRFRECILVEADFTHADADDAVFTGADLREAMFRNANVRGATFTRANLEDADFRDTDLRGAHLDQAKLDEIDVTDSRINRATQFGDRTAYETQLAQTADPDVRRELFESATWTYRAVQRLASQNARRGQAYEFYNREKDLRRRFAWAEGYSLFALKSEAERWVMGYGNNPWRVLAASLIVIVVFAGLYPLTGGVQEVGVERAITYSLDAPADAPGWWIGRVLFKSLYFSITTFATLGYGDFQPVGGSARVLAGVEALLGGLLMALLVVVLLRRITWVR